MKDRNWHYYPYGVERWTEKFLPQRDETNVPIRSRCGVVDLAGLGCSVSRNRAFQRRRQLNKGVWFIVAMSPRNALKETLRAGKHSDANKSSRAN